MVDAFIVIAPSVVMGSATLAAGLLGRRNPPADIIAALQAEITSLRADGERKDRDLEAARSALALCEDQMDRIRRKSHE